MKKGTNNEIEIYQNFDFHFCIQEKHDVFVFRVCFNVWGKARSVRTYIELVHFRSQALTFLGAQAYAYRVIIESNDRKLDFPWRIPAAYKVTFEATTNTA